MFNNFMGNNMFSQNNNSCCPVISEEKCCADPVYETPIEKCVQKDFVHEVVHICPIHTRVVNNHIYKHTYMPEYTCSEENVCTNIDDCCNKF